MNEEMIVEIASAFGQGSGTIVVIILWLKSKFETARKAWVSDFKKVLDAKITEVEDALRLKISEHGDEIEAAKSTVSDLGEELRDLRTKLEKDGKDIARLEGFAVFKGSE